MEKVGRRARAPKMLIADDDPCVLRALADRSTRMGFEVETATNGLRTLVKASRYNPDILVVDVHMPEVDGLSVCAFLQGIVKQFPHVMVVTGRPDQEIVERCEKFDAVYVHKGKNFWSEFEDRLAELFPHKAKVIRRTRDQSAEIEVRTRPRILLVDDDITVKKFLFSKFAELGVELLYAADATRGYWAARREEPTVIVADYFMPNGDAEYLLTRLRKTPETGSIPIIVLTGRRLDDAVKKKLRQQIYGRPGATRILQKSSDIGELFDVLQRLCGFAKGLGREFLHQ
jgi:CheY-like chemotaxis protein